MKRINYENSRMDHSGKNIQEGLDNNTLLTRAQQVLSLVNQVVLGKEREIREVMMAFLSNGHVLLRDIPGVGKTTLAVAFSRVMSFEYNRVQFTPDLLPSDLTGFSVYRRDEERFVYMPGAVFCNLLLADEINRTSPKTQSALLEVMQEGSVTVDGETREVPSPFLVIATENPLGSVGTQPLPEAQIDRFMATLSLGYPSFENELQIARGASMRDSAELLQPVIGGSEFRAMQRAADQVFIHDGLYRYIVELVTATRAHPYIRQGASPRGTLALVHMSRASAWLQGRGFVTAADIAEQFPYIIRHRFLLNRSAAMDHVDKDAVIREILEKTKRPSIGENIG